MKIKKSLAYREVAGEMFVVDAAAARLHELNGPAAVIWAGLAKGRGAAAIAADIAEKFEVDQATALADTEEFISELTAAGLLTA